MPDGHVNREEHAEICVEVEDNVKRWFRSYYHDVLKEEISLGITKWMQTKYAVVTTLIGMVALFGLNEYYSNKIEQLVSPTAELQKELEAKLAEVNTLTDRLEALNASVDGYQENVEKLAALSVQIESVSLAAQGRLDTWSTKVDSRFESDELLRLASR